MTPARREAGQGSGRVEGVVWSTEGERGGSVGASAALERFHSEIEFHMTAIFYDIVSISYGIRFTQLKKKKGKNLP